MNVYRINRFAKRRASRKILNNWLAAQSLSDYKPKRFYGVKNALVVTLILIFAYATFFGGIFAFPYIF